MPRSPDPPPSIDALPWRGILVGCVGVVATGMAAPFNDWVMRNTPLVGSFLAVGVLLAMLLLVIIVNAGIARVLPRARLGPRDLTATLVLLLVGSSFASVGLVRYLPGYLVMLWDHAAANPSLAAILGKLDLPDWLFPVHGTLAERAQSNVVRYFYTRTPGSDGSLLNSFTAVPWLAWIGPIAAWGVLMASMMLSLVAALIIFLPQWSQVERLPFPLARVYGSLTEAPAAGNRLNGTLASPAFWIAFVVVFALHLTNGFSVYTAGVVPRIPTSFDLSTILTDGSWAFAETFFKQQTIYFSIVGMMYFVQTGKSLSLWLAMVLLQVVRMVLGTGQLEVTNGMAADEQNGAIVAMAFVTLFLARRHLRTVLRGSFGFGGEASTRCDWAARFVLIGLIGQVAWLHCAGASVFGAIAVSCLLLMLYLTVARTLAETGIPYLVLPLDFRRFVVYALHDVPGVWTPSLRDGFWASALHGLFTHDTRECAAGFVSTAMKCGEQPSQGKSPRRWITLLVGLIALALALSYVSSWAGYLLTDYRYSATLDRGGVSPVNDWGAYRMSQTITLDFLNNEVARVAEPHSRLLHFAIGSVGLIALMFASVRLPWWPLAPVGFLLVHTWGLKTIWFSIFLGWLAKVLIVRLGGAKLLQTAQPVFLGLILGEACSAAFWLFFAVLRLNAGLPYERIQLLPT